MSISLVLTLLLSLASPQLRLHRFRITLLSLCLLHNRYTHILQSDFNSLLTLLRLSRACSKPDPISDPFFIFLLQHWSSNSQARANVEGSLRLGNGCFHWLSISGIILLRSTLANIATRYPCCSTILSLFFVQFLGSSNILQKILVSSTSFDQD